MNTVVVMFNETDPADSLAFANWISLADYISYKVSTDFDWRTRAYHLYKTKREEIDFSTNLVKEFFTFEEWLDDLSLCETIELASYFGYSNIEEIDYEV